MGLVPPGSSEERLSSSFWWLPVILGVPWLVATSLQSLSSLSHGFLPSVFCVFASKAPSPFSYEDTSGLGLGPTPTPYDLTLTELSVKTLLISRFIVTGIWD